MAEKQKPDGFRMPATSYFFVIPIGATLSLYLFKWVLTAEDFLPFPLPKSLSETTYRCLALSTLPMLLMVLTVIAFRVMTTAGNTLLHAESPLMKVHINALSNTTEQTLAFALNLIAFSTLERANSERIVVFTGFFVASRLVFWLGYYLFFLTGLTVCRSPGMLMTLAVNIFLLGLNVLSFFS